MRKLGISTGKSRLSPQIKRHKVSWGALRDKLLKVKRTRETFEEYMALSSEDQTQIKDVGYFVGGVFSSRIRRQEDLKARFVVTLDIDHLPPWDLGLLEDTYGDLEYVVHSTHKHQRNEPRLRIVFPLSRPVRATEYEPLARKLAHRMGMDWFDDTTYQASRIMFWGSASKDGEVYTAHNEGEWVDPREILAEYEDVSDFGEWPISSREDRLTMRVQEAADPLTAPGVIGAFNRVFDIHRAITEFDLPYEATSHDNRYLPVGSTGAAGAVVYDDVFLYSHHESDPAGLKNCNAFDLVRLHLFGDWSEEELDEDKPVTQRESFKEMAALAGEYQEVQQELVEGDFEDLGEAGEGGKEKRRRLTFPALRLEIESLESPSNDDLSKTITRIAAARLEPAETDVLASILKQMWPAPAPQKGSILKQIAMQAKRLAGSFPDSKGEVTDIEHAWLQSLMDKHFGSGEHIRRWAKLFWVYRNGVWKSEEDERIKAVLIDHVFSMREERPEEYLQLVASVADSKASTLVNSLWPLFCSMVAGMDLSEDPLGIQRIVRPAIANFRNGEVWIKNSGKLEFLEHDPAHHLTNQITVNFNPEAECPEYLRFMKESVLAGKDDVDGYLECLEAMMGYILQDERIHKCFCIIHGTGYNGKSALGNWLTLLLGDASVEKRMADYSEGKNTHAESGLVGKKLLIDDDYARGVALPDGFLKRASEAKHMTANPKFAAEFRFVCRVVPVILTNYWPVTRDTSLAIRERAMVFNLNHYIPPEERSERKRRHILRKEMEGIAYRWICAYARSKRKGVLPETKETRADRGLWTLMSNPASQFIGEQMVRDGAGFVRTSDVWARYRDWSRYSNPGGRMLGKAALFERMDELLGARGKRGGHEGYRGWLLKEDVEEF